MRAQDIQKGDLDAQHVLESTHIPLCRIYPRLEQQLALSCHRQPLRAMRGPPSDHAQQTAQGLPVETGALPNHR
ncbi:hypothetical protein AWT69_001742 [Pseudomonas putida]|nr:hypothetical protein AWT69_001742 [Pseudomonas putida]